MPLFLNVHQQWIKLRSSLRSAFQSSRGSRSKDSDHEFHDIQDVDLQDRSNDERGPVTDVSATVGVGRNLVEDIEIPIHSIAVRQEMQWSESQDR